MERQPGAFFGLCAPVICLLSPSLMTFFNTLLDEHGTHQTIADYATHRLIHHTAYYAYRESWRSKTHAIDMIIEDEHILVCDAGPMNRRRWQWLQSGCWKYSPRRSDGLPRTLSIRLNGVRSTVDLLACL